MKPSDFFKSLLATFSRDRVLEDCRVTHAEIKDTVAPAYRQGAELMRNWQFRSDQVVSLEKIFKEEVDRKLRDGNLVVSIASGVPVVLDNLETLSKLSEDKLGEEITAQAMTYFRANLLQLVEGANFFARYARALLIFIYVHESAPYVKDTDQQADAIRDHLVPADISFVMDNFRSFCTIFNALAMPNAELKKKVLDVPEVNITEANAQTMPHTAGNTKIDPMKLGFIAAWLNPIYHIRIAVADYQFSRYKLAERELANLQLRKMNLEQLSRNQPGNAKLESDIRYTERQIGDLRAKLTKMEEDYA